MAGHFARPFSRLACGGTNGPLDSRTMTHQLSPHHRRFVRALVALALAASGYAAFAEGALAAALTGTYRFDSPQGPIMATIEVRGSRLTGSIDFFGKSTATLDGSVQSESIASGSISFERGNGAFAAALHNDTLELTLFQAGGPRPAATPPLSLRRIVPTAKGLDVVPEAGNEIGDKRLVGSWVYRDEFFSEEDSVARNEYLELHADGTYVLGKSGEVPEAVGELPRAGQARKPESGHWRAEDGTLYFRNKGGAEWFPVGRYAIKAGDRAMRISYERGNRKLWTRQ
jgi:hypothetical protein